MNAFYFLGTIGNRIINFLNIILLTYILDSNDFGVFILCASVVLFSNITIGWWMNSAAYRFISVSDNNQLSQNLGSLAYSMIFLSGPIALTTFLVTLWIFSDLSLVWPVAAAASAWAVASSGYDLTLAANNAQDRALPYAKLSVLRNALALTCSAGMAFAGWGVVGALIGQAIGTILALAVIKSATEIWARAKLTAVSFSEIPSMFRFGAIGVFTQGLYMLIQAPGRTAMEYSFGPAAAGHYALGLDLFFAPVVLIGSSFSLSRLRSQFQADTSEAATKGVKETAHQVELFSLLFFPYAVIGGLAAGELTRLIVAPSIANGVAEIALPVVILAGIIGLLNSLLTAFLIAEFRRIVIASALFVIIFNTVAIILLGRGSVFLAAWVSTFFMTGCLVVLFFIARFYSEIPIRLWWVVKIIAVSSFAASIGFGSSFLIEGISPIAYTTFGGIIFLAVSQVVGIVNWRVFIQSKGLVFY